MKFALHAVGCGSTARPEVLTQVAQKAEALGFESVWIPEHLAVPVTMRSPYPYSPDGKFPGGPQVALHDPFVALAFVASCTSRIKLGTGVFVLPLRNAIAVAKAFDRLQPRFRASRTHRDRSVPASGTICADRHRARLGSRLVSARDTSYRAWPMRRTSSLLSE